MSETAELPRPDSPGQEGKGNKDGSDESKEVVEDNGAVLIRNLSRNVKEAHLKEIFSNYGEVLKVTLRQQRGERSAELLFSKESQANNAVYFMDTGVIDGQEIKASFILVQKQRSRANSQLDDARLRKPGENGQRAGDRLREDNRRPQVRDSRREQPAAVRRESRGRTGREVRAPPVRGRSRERRSHSPPPASRSRIEQRSRYTAPYVPKSRGDFYRRDNSSDRNRNYRDGSRNREETRHVRNRVRESYSRSRSRGRSYSRSPSHRRRSPSQSSRSSSSSYSRRRRRGRSSSRSSSSRSSSYSRRRSRSPSTASSRSRSRSRRRGRSDSS